uniref:DM2 domain-containing protein n=1 Tax=Chromera velia CCMP2878 TaxID=1169474 RepID=A0A0G4HNL7_9ALVE|eukprot:Cvel_7665.t1-p1 / transcript=Cvel_7665.t1 / gene=Cvel_7665 / organism=Chromera_velia_CCMP2878 / gene_product=SWI/SNF complex component SNF12 homolog, putative / transcript_product=SWI/SNF complex component SNF12 homolog, putative / location=Cvel_scaffold406:56033-65504(-) / protein_length=813 / sequence_SO=supercontig / SO=protein_coding / is_pseudo=false
MSSSTPPTNGPRPPTANAPFASVPQRPPPPQSGLTTQAPPSRPQQVRPPSPSPSPPPPQQQPPQQIPRGRGRPPKDTTLANRDKSRDRPSTSASASATVPGPRPALAASSAGGASRGLPGPTRPLPARPGLPAQSGSASASSSSAGAARQQTQTQTKAQGVQERERERSGGVKRKASGPPLHSFLPDSVKDVDSSAYSLFCSLSDHEKNLEDAYSKRVRALQELHAPSATDKGFVRRVRVHVYNFARNQVKEPDTYLNAFSTENWTCRPPPSWVFRLQCHTDDKGGAPVKLGGVFKKIVMTVQWPSPQPQEVLTWESGTNPPTDGLEICREGETEVEIRILLFVAYKTAQYTLSRSLARVCGVSQSSLPGILKAVWRYCNFHSLLIREKPGVSKTDECLAEVLEGKSMFSFPELAGLLKEHISPPRPMEISHKVKMTGEWFNNEQVHELWLEIPAGGNPDIADVLTLPQDSQLRGAPSVRAPHVPFVSQGPGRPRSSSGPLNKTQGSGPPQSEGMRVKAKAERAQETVGECLQAVWSASARRSFFLSFAENPVKTIRDLLVSKTALNSQLAPSSSSSQHNQQGGGGSSSQQQQQQHCVLAERGAFEESVRPWHDADSFNGPWVFQAVDNYLSKLSDRTPISPSAFPQPPGGHPPPRPAPAGAPQGANPPHANRPVGTGLSATAASKGATAAAAAAAGAASASSASASSSSSSSSSSHQGQQQELLQPNPLAFAAAAAAAAQQQAVMGGGPRDRGGAGPLIPMAGPGASSLAAAASAAFHPVQQQPSSSSSSSSGVLPGGGAGFVTATMFPSTK